MSARDAFSRAMFVAVMIAQSLCVAGELDQSQEVVNGGISVNTKAYVAQAFAQGANLPYLAAIWVGDYAGAGNTYPLEITLEIRNGVGVNPTGFGLIHTEDFTLAGAPADGWFKFVFALPVALKPTLNYTFILKGAAGTTGTTVLALGTTNASYGGTALGLSTSADGGASWSTHGGFNSDLRFRTYLAGATIPEPATLNLPALGSPTRRLSKGTVGGLAETEDIQLHRVVVPSEPSPAEQNAAAELIRYVNTMTGQQLPLVVEGEAGGDGRAILVGRTKDNLANHNPDKWPLDTIYIGYGDGDIAIIGQGDQGTLFAAYEFLRDQGCRWYMPSVGHELEAGECIPRRTRLDLPEEPKKHTPSFEDRGWHTTAVASPGLVLQFKLWAARNGVNAITTGATAIYYPPHLGYGRQKQTGHTLRAFVTSGNHPTVVVEVQATFAAHPEWYPMVNGERTWMYKDGRPAQACLSNPEVAEEAARGIIERFENGYDQIKDPRWWLFSLGHNDEPSYWCECASCLAMDGPGSTWKSNDNYDAYPDEPECKGGPGALSDRYATFANRVARLVARELPGKYVSFYAYGSTVAPPRDPDLTLDANVIAEFAYSGHCLRHDIDDPDCKYSTNLREWIRDWTARGKVIYYDYPPTGRHINIPTGYFAHYKKLLGHLKNSGVIGLSGESQGTWAGSALFHTIKARLLWDIDADVDQIIHEFCRDMYGEAATTMERFYTTYEQQLMEFPGHMVWGDWVRTFDNDHLRTLQTLLDQGRGQAASPLVQKRLQMLQASLNCFVLTQMELDPAAQTDAGFDRYEKLQSDTLRIVEELNLPFPMVVTGPYKDRLKRGAYRPPFEAINGKELLTLPLVWRFRTDPADEGLKQGWSGNPSTDGSQWHDIRVDDYWTSQGFNYHGAAWYATTLTIPDGAEDYLWLLFQILDGEAEIWVDGQSAGKLPGDPWDKPKSVELTKLIKPGGEHQVVIRVVKEIYAAGICGPVKLTESYKMVGDTQ